MSEAVRGTTAVGGGADVIVGRAAERAAVDALVDRARAGAGGAMVVRGEPGVGKSTILADAAARAEGVTVLRTSGIESEAPLPFAALQRLLRPVMQHAQAIPAPQATALGVAFGEATGGEADRFLLFLGTLNLLSEAGGQQPVLAVVDDAHWLDEASAAALQFVARRLQAEPVAVLFGARTGDVRSFDSGDLPTLDLAGLDRAAVEELLVRRAGSAVSPEVGAQILAGTGGNPLALVELPDVLTAEQLTGRASLPRMLPATRSVERVFLDRARRLSPDAQTVLLVAAADDSARLATVVAAAQRLGAGPRAVDEVERSGLMSTGAGTVELRHPLVRSAVYGAATSLRRREVHRALADALFHDADTDRRVWHLAAATDQPDEAVVAELDLAGHRAHRRGGHEAASSAFERAAELTLDPQGRAERLQAAARCAWLTGQPARSSRLADTAAAGASSPGLRAEIALLRARVEWNTGDLAQAYRMIIQAAFEVAPVDPARAQEMAVFASSVGCFCDTTGVAPRPLDLVQPIRPESTPRERCMAALIIGFEHAHHGRWAEAVTAFREAFAVEVSWDHSEQDLLPNAAVAAGLIADHHTSAALTTRQLARARETGAMVLVLYAQTRLALTDLVTGRWAAAGTRAEEAVALALETGQQPLVDAPRSWLLLLAALRGDASRYDELAPAMDAAVARPPSGTVDVWMRDAVRWAKGIRAVDNPATAFHHLAQISHHVMQQAAAIDRLEAAVRAGHTETAELWVGDLESFADATEQRWVAAAASHGRALLADGGDAEHHFERALALHEDSLHTVAEARTRLAYGEHLRRARRRVDAREQLRAALATFEDLGATSWVERTVAELRASGESARKRDVTTAASLTPQELQVAALVRQGLSNREVATQLFLSPRTIDFHLRNVFTKLGISSRTELAGVDLD